ncbi:hypothetical protein ACQPW1_22935 [Nocardia sp. CA-128927]|uniref:hypothetical protein n=1 Tax=Nocardia sp. CA-128927 TaxID=3239975 RepID=UPI003D99A93B
MIGTGKDLLAWIEANLPPLDEHRYGPWQAEPACPGSVFADVEVRIHHAGTTDRVAAITLSAALRTDLPDSDLRSPNLPRSNMIRGEHDRAHTLPGWRRTRADP